MGTPDFSVPVLEALSKEHDVICVYSQPPRPAGRGYELTPSPVHKKAQELGVEVRTPLNFKEASEKQAFADLKADIAVVAAYGLILPEAVLNAFPYRCINVHASILPRWRGAAPIQRSIMAGDAKSGVTIMQMEKGLDTGDMLLIKETLITEDTDAGKLHDALSAIGAEIINPAIAGIVSGEVKPQKQDDALTTYAAKIDKSESKIDWNKSSIELSAFIRGLIPYPGAYFEHNGQRVKIHGVKAMIDAHNKPAGTIVKADDELHIACSEGVLALTKLQKAGKGVTDVKDFLHGYKFEVGEQL